VRLEPTNAGIWRDLAQIRLQQRQYKQAEDLAANPTPWPVTIGRSNPATGKSSWYPAAPEATMPAPMWRQRSPPSRNKP